MRNILQIIIGVAVAFLIVCAFNMAYAKDGGEPNNTGCNGEGNDGSPCAGTAGDNNNAGVNIDLVNKIRNDVQNQIDNQVINNITNTNTSNSQSAASVGDITNTNNASAVVGDITNKNINSNTIGDITNRNNNTNTNTIGDISNKIGDITNTATGGNSSSNSSSKSNSFAAGGNAFANGGSANATGGNATGGNAVVGDIKNTNTASGGDGGDASAVANGGEGGKADAKASATAGDNKGNNQTVNMKFEDSPDHINPPAAPTINNRLTDHGDKMSIKTRGSVFGMKQHFTKAQASFLGKGASDAKVEYAVFMQFEETKEIRIGVENAPEGIEPMGYIYILPDGPDCTLAQLQGKLMEAAMKIGASYIDPNDDKGAYLEGTSWSVGLGGGASILSNGGQMAIAPSAGLGGGKAKSNNEMRPAVMAAVYGFKTKASSEDLPYIPLDDSEYEGGRR